MASRVALLFLLCALPAFVAAGRLPKNQFSINKYLLQGRVFCDTCRAGFETSATTYIEGATVRVECKDRNTMEVRYTMEGTTDQTGTYKIRVNEDHEDQICDCMLVSSPELGCNTAAPGRDKARVTLTSYNGVASEDRYANAMGFMKEEAVSGCDEILRQYQEFDE
ncbi:Pollen-specific protein [Quillaja saponaria]|uniref:Pollen-specific protein n=1 Tax=Quillaja saponaria TaxID=32244 RepID=A0AAD7LWM7_QUISA|nr:Pollen-specific protein [Quillaja saponaria]